MPVARLLPLLLALALLACGDDEEPSAGGTPAATATATATPAGEGAAEPAAPVEDDGGGAPYIGSLSVDPGDGTLILGTGLGLFRLAPGDRRAEKVEGTLATPQGKGAVSSNLEVLHGGPGELLASGHPEGGGPLPEDLGLMRSGDHGDTWEPVSDLGEVDWHALARSGATIGATPVDSADVYASTDGGAAFEQVGVAPDLPEDLEIDPADPRRWAIATADGLATSADGGATWRPRDAVAGAHLAWARPGELYRVDPGGVTWMSADGGATWEERGRALNTANALSAGPDGRLYVALPDAVVQTSDDGGRTWEELVRLD